MDRRAGMREVLRGAVEYSPLALVVASYGIIFGVLARGNGLSVAETSLMSLTVFAGASQFIALPMIRDGVSAWALILMALLVNLRHLLYGLTIGRMFPRAGRKLLLVLSFGIIDENYAFVTLGPGKGRATPLYFIGTGLCTYLGWNAGTLLGATAGGLLPPIPRQGLDFVVMAVFLALVGGGLRKGEDWAVMVAAGAVALLVQRLAGGYWHLVAAGVVVPLAFAIFDSVRGRIREAAP